MSGQHTQGRLTFMAGRPGRAFLVAVDDQTTFVASYIEPPNARRLAACWNFCEGMMTETIEAAKKPAFQYLADADQHSYRLSQELAAVRADANQMLAEHDARIAEFESAMESLRADVLHGVDGLDNDQVNIVLGMIDFYTPSESPDEEPPTAPLFASTSEDTEGGSCD